MVYKVTLSQAYSGTEFVFTDFMDAASFMGVAVNNGVYYSNDGPESIRATLTLVTVPTSDDGEEVE